MAKFSDLPNELVVEIWSYIPQPRDIENFAFASKTIRTLAGKVLVKHRELTRGLSTFDIGNSKSRFSVAGLLKEILTNPRTALYIKTVTITHFHEVWESVEEGVNTLKTFDPEAGEGERQYRHTPYVEEDMELFKQTIERAYQFLDFKLLGEYQDYQNAEWQVSRLCKLMQEGNELPIIVLLLLFTNLETIPIESTAANKRFFGLLAHISEGAGIPVLKRPIKVKVLNTDHKDTKYLLRWMSSRYLPSSKDTKGEVPWVMAHDHSFSFDLRAWSMNVHGMWTL